MDPARRAPGMRMILILRYVTQYQRNRDLPEAIQRRLATDTLEVHPSRRLPDVKEIVRHDAATN